MANIGRLKVVVGDLLEASVDFRGRSNPHIHLKFAPCEVSSLIQATHKYLFDSDASRGGYIRDRVSVLTRILETLPLVYVDCSSISGVLTRLISHALINSGQYLHVDIEAYEAKVSDKQSVVIALRFNKKVVILDDALESKYGGYFYTRRAIEANTGKLWYENRDEKTSFYVALPIYQSG